MDRHAMELDKIASPGLAELSGAWKIHGGPKSRVWKRSKTGPLRAA